MASNSISPPSTHIHKLQPFTTTKRPLYPHFPKLTSSSSAVYRCSAHNNSWRWDSALRHILKNAVDRFDSLFNSDVPDTGVVVNKPTDVGEWDWERWLKHFAEVDEQERFVSFLKSQINNAVHEEEYNDAASLKVAHAAAAANDSVGRVISNLNRAIEEERYEDAAIIRDNACAGLVGWWASVSKDGDDPYGRIICITAEHGRYLARSFSPRQLATGASGAPLFEVFLTVDKNGEYKQQAVYLKRGASKDPLKDTSKLPTASSNLNQFELSEKKSELIDSSGEEADDDDADTEDDDHSDDPDITEGQSGYQNNLNDMIPGVKVNVLKVTEPGKVDRDMISKVIDQIVEEENEDKDFFDVDNVESEDENVDEPELEKDQIEVDAANGIFGSDKPKDIAVDVVIGGGPQKYASRVSTKDLIRVPAKLEKKGRMSFSFSIEKEVKHEFSGSKDKTVVDKKVKLQRRPPIDSVIFDIKKVIGQEKIPVKLLKNIGDLINLKMNQAKNQKPLSGSTTFNRIAIPTSSDPLNGLYIGAHGLYTSEVIQLRHRYGQWREDGGTKSSSSLEFYEYVEALKITGDPYVPAGQVAFRAKVGKRYQLPHKGIIPEEFGVVARYKGQGRLAEPGFQNPRWVDGELVILDGKYIKGGPVVGFVYWAPEYHFLVFFNQLRLQI